MSYKVLVVDDEPLVRNTLEYWLTREGYEVSMADTVQEALRLARRERPHLILLDVGLPDGNGFDLARTLTGEQMPIIFITGRSHESDVVAAFELGAEDYVTKPYRLHELLARVRAVLRRASRMVAPPEDQVLDVGEVSLDPNSRIVLVRGQKVTLPPKEFELLRLLMANAGTVLTTNYLLDKIWGEDFSGAPHVLYVHIGWLREMIESDPHHPDHIQTARGIGYKFAARNELP